MPSKEKYVPKSSTYINWNNQSVAPHAGGLKELEGEKLAKIVGMIQKPLGKSYGKMFAEESSEKNIFGGEGGWSFPLINRIRGGIQAKRFQKGLESGDIKTYGLHKEGKDLYSRLDGVNYRHRTVGEYEANTGTKSKSDGNMYLATDRPVSDLLSTLAHEGGHMETMTGKQVGHASEHTGQRAFKENINDPIKDYYKNLTVFQRDKHLFPRIAEQKWLSRDVQKARNISSLVKSLQR